MIKFLTRNTTLLLGAILVAFQLYYVQRFFPLTEGWHETYGYLISKGMVPIKDFSIESTLVFAYFNNLLLHITHNFFILRLIGIAFSLILFMLAARVLSNFFHPQVSSFAAFLALLLSMTSSVYIAKDYHTFVDILILTYLMFLIRAIDQALNDKNFTLSVIGIAISLSILVFLKQNIGIFLIIGFACIALFIGRKLFFYAGIATALSIIWWIYIFQIAGVSLSELLSVTVENDSKGSASTVLTRFVTDSTNRSFLGNAIKYFVFILFIFHIPFRDRAFKIIKMHYSLNRKTFNYFVFGGVVYVGYYSSVNIVRLIHELIPLSIAALCFVGYLNLTNLFKIERSSRYKILAFVWSALVLVYCNTHTASLNSTGMMVPISLLLAIAFTLLLKIIDHDKFLQAVLLVSLLFSVNIGLQKATIPYSWWGYTQSKISSAIYRINDPMLAEFLVDKSTSIAFNKILDEARRVKASGGSLYFSPSIPIFYLLTDTLPPFKSPIQWYDFTSSKSLENELQMFRKNPPDLIVFLDPPGFVDKGHEGLIKRESFISKFRDELFNRIKAEQYSVIYRMWVSGDDLEDASEPSLQKQTRYELIIAQRAE